MDDVSAARSRLKAAFGPRLLLARSVLDLSQVEVARRCGVQSHVIWMYEKGRALPSVEMLARLSMALDGLSLDWLIHGHGEGPSAESAPAACSR